MYCVVFLFPTSIWQGVEKEAGGYVGEKYLLHPVKCYWGDWLIFAFVLTKSNHFQLKS